MKYPWSDHTHDPNTDDDDRMVIAAVSEGYCPRCKVRLTPSSLALQLEASAAGVCPNAGGTWWVGDDPLLWGYVSRREIDVEIRSVSAIRPQNPPNQG